MVKGCEKRMIRLQNAGNRYFEEVYFVLRETPEKSAAASDILAEANRILEENTPPKVGKSGLRAALIPFSAGAALGMALATILLSILFR